MLFHIILQTYLTTVRKPFIESNYQRCIFISICQSLIHLIFSTWRLWTRLSNYWVLHKSFWIVVSTSTQSYVPVAYISKSHVVRYLILPIFASSERTAFVELHGSYNWGHNHGVITAAAAVIVCRVCLSLTAVTSPAYCLPTACAAPASYKKLINCHKSVFKLKWTENTLNSHINIST